MRRNDRQLRVDYSGGKLRNRRFGKEKITRMSRVLVVKQDLFGAGRINHLAANRTTVA